MRSMIASAGGGRVEEVRGGLCLAHPLLPTPEFNRVARTSTELDLDAVAAFYNGLGVRRYTVSVPPESAPLAATLEAHGFTRGYAWMKFERDAAAPDPAENKLRVVETDDSVAFELVAGAGFGLPDDLRHAFPRLVGRPGWYCFVAWAGAEPAACGALFVDGTVGWLGVGATRPEFRRRGGQSALIAARIAKACELGVERVTTETGERVDDRPSGSYRNILRAGFCEAYLRPNWLAPA